MTDFDKIPYESRDKIIVEIRESLGDKFEIVDVKMTPDGEWVFVVRIARRENESR